MQDYLIRRLLLGVFTVWLVAAMIFVLLRVLPGDVVTAMLGSEQLTDVNQAGIDAIRRELGLDQPIYVQFGIWMWSLMRLDFGTSFVTREPVWEVIRYAIPVTIQLALFSKLISITLAVVAGTLSAMRQDTWVDYFFRVFTIAGLAMPSFWVAIIVVLGFTFWFNYLPPTGYHPLLGDPLKSIEQFLLPSLILGWRSAAVVGRMIRSTILEVLREDYVRTARAKGLTERAVVIRHVLKNAALPAITLLGFQFSQLLAGAVTLELVFGLPGVGRALVSAINFRDFPIIQVLIMFFATITVISNLLVDLAYGWLDPRIRYS